MEALAILKFWRNAVTTADVSSEGDDVRTVSSPMESEETDDEDSFFDLVIKSPERRLVKSGDEVSKKDPQLLESPRDVFHSKNEFSNSKPLSPVTLLRSTPKFKVFMLGMKKQSKSESNAELKLNQSKIEQSNCVVDAKCRAEEILIASNFARDNSLRSKLLKESSDYDVVSSEKSIPKYLKLIKPFYSKSSKKARFTDAITPLSSPVTASVNFSPKKLSDGSRIGSFKIRAKNLGKSRSASMTVGISNSLPPIRRRDDLLLEQNEGIQGAILHCKKSYNSSSQEFSQLFRSSSDSMYPVRNSYEEQKRCSI